MTVPATPAGKPRRHAWMLWCLFPLGFGAWVPLVAGLRARLPLWIVLGAVFCQLRALALGSPAWPATVTTGTPANVRGRGDGEMHRAAPGTCHPGRSRQ